MEEKRYEMRTNGGYNFFHVSSAFQKLIRRGKEEDALYWATELFDSGYGEYVMYRSIVIATEDVGLADPNVIVQIMALQDSWAYLKKKKNKHKPERLPLFHSVMVLARAKKSRLIDNKICQYWELKENVERLEIPDYAFDNHTIEGRMKGRGNDYFFEESAKITNDNLDAVPEDYTYRDKVWEQYKVLDKRKKRGGDGKSQSQLNF